MRLVASAEALAAVESMGAEQKEHTFMEVLMVSLQRGHGKTWTAGVRLRFAIVFSF
jgi:hypothetical protein